MWPKVTSQWARHFANQMGIDSYVLFGSNTTYVWTGSPQVIILFTARFEYDHKPDQEGGTWSKTISPQVIMWNDNDNNNDTFTFEEGKKDRGPALLFIIIYTWLWKYVHHESWWLKCSKAEAELCSTADGSPPPICVSPCGLEHR